MNVRPSMPAASPRAMLAVAATCAAVLAVPGAALASAGQARCAGSSSAAASAQALQRLGRATVTNQSLTDRATPLVLTVAADTAVVPVGSTEGYTVTVENVSTADATLTSLTDVLPAGFAYVPGSSSGLTTADPASAGQGRTWSGQYDVPAGSSATLHFEVQVAQAPDLYLTSVSGTGSVNVAGFVDTAPIVALGGPLHQAICHAIAGQVHALVKDVNSLVLARKRALGLLPPLHLAEDRIGGSIGKVQQAIAATNAAIADRQATYDATCDKDPPHPNHQCTALVRQIFVLNLRLGRLEDKLAGYQAQLEVVQAQEDLVQVIVSTIDAQLAVEQPLLALMQALLAACRAGTLGI